MVTAREALGAVENAHQPVGRGDAGYFRRADRAVGRYVRALHQDPRTSTGTCRGRISGTITCCWTSSRRKFLP